MRNNFILLLLLTFSLTASAQSPKSFSLDEAITYALSNSLSIKNAQIGIADANEQIKENKALGLPTVSATLGYNHYLKLPVSLVPAEFFGGQAGEFAELAFGTKNNISAAVDVQSLLFDWSYLTALKAARAYRSYSEEEKVMTEADVKNQVRSAYLPSLIIDESKKTLEKNIANVKNLRFETSELYKAGFVEQLDVDRLDLTIANLETQLGNLDRQKQLVYNTLKLVMNYPIDQEIIISDNLDKLLVEASVNDLEADINYSSRPEYRLANMGKKLNLLNIDYVKSTYYPNLVGFGQYSQSGQSDDFFNNNIWIDVAVVGVQMNVPLYSGGGKKAKLQRAQLDLARTENQMRSLERVIWLEVGNARIAYKNARVNVAEQEKNLALAQRIYDTTQIKYKEGVGSSLEITQAEQALFQSQQNIIQARYELLLAKIDLDKALGK